MGKQIEDVHFSTVIERWEVQYDFGLDWRGDAASAPLTEDVLVELGCDVREPERQAGKELTVRIMFAPSLADGLQANGPRPSSVGHLVWAPSRKLSLWLPSLASLWGIAHGVASQQLRRLSFSVHGPLRGVREVQHVYVSGASNAKTVDAARQ